MVIFEGVLNFAIFSQTVRVGFNFAKIGKSKFINFTISALSLAIQIKASNILEILIKKSNVNTWVVLLIMLNFFS